MKHYGHATCQRTARQRRHLRARAAAGRAPRAGRPGRPGAPGLATPPAWCCHAPAGGRRAGGACCPACERTGRGRRGAPRRSGAAAQRSSTHGRAGARGCAAAPLGRPPCSAGACADCLRVAPWRAGPAPVRHLEAVPADDAVDGRELGRLGRQRGHALPRCAAGRRGPRQRPHSYIRLPLHATKRACMAMEGRSRRPPRARTEGAVHRDNETGTVQGPASAGALASPAGQPPAPRASAGTITRAEPARAAQAPDARAGPAPA